MSADPMNTPLPPVSSVDKSAAGPGGRATVDGVVVVGSAGVSASLSSLAHALNASVSTASAASALNSDSAIR
jgi:hypothetical protein